MGRRDSELSELPLRINSVRMCPSESKPGLRAAVSRSYRLTLLNLERERVTSCEG